MPYSKVAVHNLFAQAQPRRLGWPHTPLRVLNKKRQHTHVNSAFKILAQASVEQPARTQADTQRLLDKAVGLINTADLLAPFDRVTYTAALVIWQAIADIPPADRSELLDRLNARDIKRLWRLAGQRYQASQQQLQLCVSSYDIWDDLPTEPDQVTEFAGKAAVPLSGMFKFQKAFFLHPKTDELYGHVQLQKGPLGNALYPLYYKASVMPSLVPATDELTDLQLDYQSPNDLGLQPEHIPKGWPQPKQPLYPFSGGLIDYCRLVAPGVFVGVGWKAARPEIVTMFQVTMLVVLQSISSMGNLANWSAHGGS